MTKTQNAKIHAEAAQALAAALRAGTCKDITTTYTAALVAAAKQEGVYPS